MVTADLICLLQAPLSRVEKDQFLNDRYAAMEERLAVSS